jgi:hypothetical protein
VVELRLQERERERAVDNVAAKIQKKKQLPRWFRFFF